MMFIHEFSAVSPQESFLFGDMNALNPPANNKLYATEPAYEGIPKGALRRMSKPVRMGVGAAYPLLDKPILPAGIIMGTANAGMDDCFHFLQQIVQYDEGLLTPGNFVQSTPNALPAQLSMMTHNHGYNITHVHLGLAFENALIDAYLMLADNPANTYLVGAVDDISAYNHNINRLEGWYKTGDVTGFDLYEPGSAGSIPGEGAAIFRVNATREGSVARVVAVDTLHSTRIEQVANHLREFLEQNLPVGETVDILLSGENGDSRLLAYYVACEKEVGDRAIVLRFKHMSGEYPTATSFGCWIAAYIFQQQSVPGHMVKYRGIIPTPFRNILLYNNFKGNQHSFILLSAS
jgi:hypothetical protein